MKSGLAPLGMKKQKLQKGQIQKTIRTSFDMPVNDENQTGHAINLRC